jgi:hypothetical protein
MTRRCSVRSFIVVTRRNIGPLDRGHSRVIISIWGAQLPRSKVQGCLRPMAKPVTLHPSIIPRLDPEYASFHNEHLIHFPQVHELPWDPSVRNTQKTPGSSELLPVGKVEDFNLSRCRVRVFTPEGSPPETGWPVFIFFHGGMGTIPPPQHKRFSRRQRVGGWTLGNIDTENVFCTNACKSKSCRHYSNPDYTKFQMRIAWSYQ